MPKDAGVLKYLDIPFSFAIFTLLFDIDWTNLKNVTSIILLASIIASTLELLDPVAFVIKQFTISSFRERTINVPSQPAGIPRIPMYLHPIAPKATNVEALARTRNKITGTFYFLIILILSYFKIDTELLGSFIIAFRITIIIAFLLVLILFIIEIFNFPRTVYLVIIYLLKIEGNIPDSQGTFSGIEKAIDNDDWITARYWCRKSAMDGDFSPEPRELITISLSRTRTA